MKRIISRMMLALLLIGVLTVTLKVQQAHALTGDVNGDGKVNMEDLGIAASALGTTPSSSRWDSRADITGPQGVPDEKVDMWDIGLIARNLFILI